MVGIIPKKGGEADDSIRSVDVCSSIRNTCDWYTVV